MTWWKRTRPSLRRRTTSFDDERTFAGLVEKSFAPDPGAVERVRAVVMAHEMAPTVPIAAPQRPRAILVRRGLPVAAAFTIVVVLGLLTFDGSGHVAQTSSPSADQAAILAVDLARSATRLDVTTAATVAGDPGAIAAALSEYRAGLVGLEADVLRPGSRRPCGGDGSRVPGHRARRTRRFDAGGGDDPVSRCRGRTGPAHRVAAHRSSRKDGPPHAVRSPGQDGPPHAHRSSRKDGPPHAVRSPGQDGPPHAVRSPGQPGPSDPAPEGERHRHVQWPWDRRWRSVIGR